MLLNQGRKHSNNRRQERRHRTERRSRTSVVRDGIGRRRGCRKRGDGETTDTGGGRGSNCDGSLVLSGGLRHATELSLQTRQRMDLGIDMDDRGQRSTGNKSLSLHEALLVLTMRGGCEKSVGGAGEGTVAGLGVERGLAGTQDRQARGNRLDGTTDRGALHVVVMLLVLVRVEVLLILVRGEGHRAIVARLHGAAGVSREHDGKIGHEWGRTAARKYRRW
jgi:hypothetical protein